MLLMWPLLLDCYALSLLALIHALFRYGLNMILFQQYRYFNTIVITITPIHALFNQLTTTLVLYRLTLFSRSYLIEHNRTMFTTIKMICVIIGEGEIKRVVMGEGGIKRNR
jgi:hypothetical protein